MWIGADQLLELYVMISVQFWKGFLFLGSKNGSKTNEETIRDRKCRLIIVRILSNYWSFSFKVNDWLKENDANKDGRLNFKEFYRSLKRILKLNIEDLEDDEDDCEEKNEEEIL